MQGLFLSVIPDLIGNLFRCC